MRRQVGPISGVWRGRYLALAAALGMAAAWLPGVANSEPQTVEAVNEGLYTHSWKPAAVTVLAGETVTFRNETEVPHGVEWRSAVQPTCTGVPVGTTFEASGTHWSGTCTFSQPGTYLYYCTIHGAAMSGTVTVQAPGTTTTSSTPPTTTTTTTTPGPAGEPPSGPAASGLAIRARQSGGLVKGTLNVSQSGAKGRLEVDARHGSARVGRLVRSSVPAGVVAFKVKLDSQARRALRHRHRLALTVKVTLTPPQGERFAVTRHVVEQG